MSNDEQPKVILEVLEKATELAVDLGHSFVGIDHVALTLVHKSADDISRIGLDFNILLRDLRDAIRAEKNTDFEDEYGAVREPEPTNSVRQLVSKTTAYIMSENRKIETLTITDMLYVLIRDGIDCHLNKVLNAPQNRRGRTMILSELKDFHNPAKRKAIAGEESQGSEVEALINLNELAEKGEIDPLIGRDTDIINISEILAKRKKNNVMLLGKAGVGKTAISEGLALGIVNKTVHESLFDKVVYSLDISALMAGTKFRGELEERALKVIKQIAEDKNAILFIDEFHTVMGAGSSTNGGLDIGNMLKPHLARGSLRCIAATTEDEYRSNVEKDKAMIRRFTNYTLGEPDKSSTLEIMTGLCDSYSKYHGVSVSESDLNTIYNLGMKYVQNRANPDKSIDILDAACASTKISGREVLEFSDIVGIVSKITSVPVEAMSASEQAESTQYIDLADNIKEKLFGQDHIVEEVSEQILLSKAGLLEDDKPIASFLLVGTSGVGKTELAKQLAKNLDMPLIRYDMSEFQEQHSVSKLIGSPPGYVGYDENRAGLIDDIEKNPSAVLLLDEIEKAHPKVLDIFLQVMDNAELTSSSGKTVKFNNVVILMTSNAGAKEGNKQVVGFASGSNHHSSEVEKAVKKFFRIEFLNRLDGILTFNNLSKEDVKRIVDKEITILNDMLGKQDIVLQVSDALKEHIVDGGFDVTQGARPIKRFINNVVKKPLSRHILLNGVTGNVSVDFKDNEVVFATTEVKDIVMATESSSTKE